jgi:hypothetical protein
MSDARNVVTLGEKAPDLTSLDNRGARVSRSDFRGRVLRHLVIWLVAAGSQLTVRQTAIAQQRVGLEAADALMARHVSAIATQGSEPLGFVLDALSKHDLVIFDDGLHNAVEPFDFYRRLVDEPAFQRLAPTIFLELLPSNRQPAIDAYLAAPREDQTLLYPAFQDDFGLPYQTYFDLLHAVYQANRNLPADHRIKVRGVNTPSMWGEIRTLGDWTIQNDIKPLGRDYFMYSLILDALDDFGSGKKGVFLTNTRHAYASLRRRNGTVFQTTSAFFRMWYPGRTYAIRFNAPVLNIVARRDTAGRARTAQGLEQFSYTWSRMADGLWDEAFAASGQKPVALSLAETPFGDAPYRGNLMLATAPGQTMHDAYDAVLFLGDAGKLHRTAINGAIYTAQFRKELRRRYGIVYSPKQLKDLLKDEQVASLDALIAKSAASAPSKPLLQANALETPESWRNMMRVNRNP